MMKNSRDKTQSAVAAGWEDMQTAAAVQKEDKLSLWSRFLITV